jgi:small subunit ribosomal protein S3
MIERKFVSENVKELRIKEFVAASLSKVGLSDVKVQRSPLGEKIIVKASRPGLVVGRAGANIQKLTKDLKEKFELENPQIEIEEIKDVYLDPAIVAEGIAGTLERFGTKQFKSAGHKSMANVMESGAMGIEILISGKIPSQRAKTWRFYQGYLKKCGDVAITSVKTAFATANLKTGAVGIKVSIMPGDTKLPDRVEMLEKPLTVVEEIAADGTVIQKEVPKPAPKKPIKKAPARRRSPPKRRAPRDAASAGEE